MQPIRTTALGPMSSPTALNNSTPFPSQSDMPLIPTSIITGRRRKSSKGTVGAIIKRSVSTPNVRGLASAENAMSLAEKRRNKLGYHRTSVACVHCRRRKIRCLLAPDDHLNRCSNCIRLKKECNFFPVDQQPSTDRRPRAGSKSTARSGNTSGSSSSSPGLDPGQAMEQVDHYGPYPILPLSTNHSFPGSMNGSMISPPASAATQFGPRGYEIPHNHDRPNWETSYYEHGPVSAGTQIHDDHSNGYSPLTPFSPFASGPPSAMAQSGRDVNGAWAPWGGPRQESSWPLPSRSQSYGHLEDLPHHFQSNYHQQFNRRASDIHHPPSLHTSANSSNTSMVETPNVPMSAPMSTQPLQSYGLPPAWHAHSGQSNMTKPPEYGVWYSEPGPLAKVQEEEVSNHYGPDPTALYSNTVQH